MTSTGFALVVGLGSVIGAAIALPNEEQVPAFVFFVINAGFAGLAYRLGASAVRLYRELYERHR